MVEERNQHQIIRKDAKNCFVESLTDSLLYLQRSYIFRLIISTNR